MKPADLPRVTDRLELFQDEWGYLLVWATLGIACIAALSLVLLPVAFGWRTIFSRNPGKFRTIVYFACLGAGYIMVEVGLISKFIQALSNATVSASVLITGMLVFSGLGSLVSERYFDRARSVMPRIFLAIGVLLIGYGLGPRRVLDWIGTFPYALRLLFCFVLIFPPAFLMGFPMPIAMTSLSRLGKDHMFLWAWGINGCFSVVGAALVPVIATSFGLAAVLIVSGCAYLLAILGFFAVLLPLRACAGQSDRGVTCSTAGCRHLLARLDAGASLRHVRGDATIHAAAAPTTAGQDRARRLRRVARSPIPASRPGRTSRSSTSRRTAGAATPPPRGGVYWEDTTYSDRRVLLHIPRGFDAALPAVMIVYFHGNLATLERDVVHRRQQVPRQVAESGLNAVLVAPQFAVNAARLRAPGASTSPAPFAASSRRRRAPGASCTAMRRARAASRACR